MTTALWWEITCPLIALSVGTLVLAVCLSIHGRRENARWNADLSLLRSRLIDDIDEFSSAPEKEAR